LKRRLLRLAGRAGLLRPAYRAYEAAQALRGRRAPPVDPGDGLPVPPAQLIVRVAGTADAEWFLSSGRLAAESVREALARQGVALENLDALLDFGCGCGRVIRNWIGLADVERFGTDLNPAAVRWCRGNLPFATFEENGLAPPLPFDDGRFDLVYALSVFTHLPEELQLAWTKELRRILRPGGWLLLSTHGEPYLERLDAAEQERFRAGDLVVRWEQVAGTNLCSAFHPESYVRSRLADGFEVVEFSPQGAAGNPHQDLTVLRYGSVRT
jgi:SAM-dependent methyltransferase